MSLSPNTKLGPYEILSRLGAGGMGEVYRAKDTRLEREVAIKVLPARLANDCDALARFEREAKAVAALSHPNILAIFDVGHERGISYVVTELLEGETLRERLRRSAIPWRKAVEIGIEIADGLSAAHSKGVIHRDLKPENLFITTAGHLKILDFGLARVAPSAAEPAELQAHAPTLTLDTRPGTVLGTVNYMSPEQIRGRVTDARTDIFSFGCVLYEMISGRRAFGGESVAEITTAILRDEPPMLSDLGRSVPAELERVIMRCHEKRPEQRIQSARDLSFALRDLLSDNVFSKPATVPHKLRTRTMLLVQLAIGVVAVAALLLTLNGGGWRERLFGRPKVNSISSLAVLPLENVSRDPEQEYFVDGMTEALISDLAKIGSLKVISRTSVMRYKASSKSLPEIARELNVDAVVEGSVLRVGDRVRITAELIHAATDEHLWTESYDRDLGDVLRLHSEVARTIAQQIKVTLTPHEQVRLTAARPVNRAAQEAYLKGRFHWNKRTPDGLRKAVDYFEQAAALDPAWPLGYVGLADAYAGMPYYSVMRPSEAIPKARTAAAKALEIDESLAEAHASLGHIATDYDWDWLVAEREFQRALTLSPNYATAHHWYAMYLLVTGRYDEAVKEITKAQELDPLSLIFGATVGWVHYFAGHFAEAEIWFRKTLELAPDYASAHAMLARTLFFQRKFLEATTEAREAVRLSNNDPMEATILGYVCAKGGQPEEARKILDELAALSKEAYVPPTRLALVHAGLDEGDRMFEWLETAYQERDVWLPLTLIDPILAPMRSDPRFADLLRRVGLPPLAPMPRSIPSRAREEAETSWETAKPLPDGRGSDTPDGSHTRSGKIMLAVLPFENLSRDPEQDYFSDGLTEEMIAQLGRLNPQKLGVIARSSAMHYKNADRAIDRVRQELGVEYVVEGSVRRAGDRVRITAQLIQVNDQTQLWAENYERDVKDIFALQRDVAERVAGSLTVELLPGAASTPARDRPIHPAAHEAHLRGRFHWNKRTPDGLRKAVEYFEQAVSLAPDWPLGYAGLADAYLLMPEYLNVRSSEAMPKARAAAARALEMDDALAEAHASMAYILGNFDWDWRAAEREFQRAIALNPNYATARQWYALHLRCNGRYDAAIRESIKAQESDPLSLIISNTVGWAYCCAGDFAQAEIRLRRTLELDADFAVAHQDLGVTLFLQGKFAEAIAEAREAVRLSDNDPSLSIASYGYICARAGQPEEARRILGELAARSTKAYVPPGLFVLLHAGLDDRDSMFDWLEKVYQEHDGWLPSTLIDPLLAEYRSDPRFVDLLHRVGLPMPTPKPIKAAESSATRVVLPPDVASIAVLPFTDLSAEKDQEYFADGLAEELLNNLVKVRGLRVAARTSSFQFRGRPDDIGTIGRKLNVGAILEGSVRKAGKRARITAQLINVADGFHLWSESYDRELEDIFAVQGDIARSVAKALKVTLLGQEEPQPAERSVNTEAYNAYLLGQHFRRRFTQEDTHKAIDYFQQAVKLDSGYAQAWVALGNAYMSQADSGSAPVAEGYAKAREAVERALGLDENLAIALSALGSIKHNYDWDWPGADAAHQKALALEPGNATVVRRTAELARTLGRFENAELLIRRALALDPLDVRAHTDLGVLLWYAGRADEAVAAYQNALELHPGLTAARWFLCLVYLTEGRPEAALTEFEQETDLGLQRLGFALTYHALGRKNDADAALMDCIQKYQVDSAFQIAQVYAFRGETDPAFEWLERAYAQRDGGLIYLKVDVLVKSLHGDPRYAALLQKMRLTP